MRVFIRFAVPQVSPVFLIPRLGKVGMEGFTEARPRPPGKRQPRPDWSLPVSVISL
jgi:hypothetical protein